MKFLKDVKVTSRLGQKGGPAKDVGTLNIEQFETLEEAVDFLVGVPAVLSLVNTQYATNKKNEVRRLANTSVSDRKIREMAMDRVLGTSDLLQQLAASEDPLSLRDQLVAEAMEEIRAEFEAKKLEQATSAEGAVDEDEEDEDER